MLLSELKLISASNIIRLRTQAGLTQAELGEKLNYSDKTISKWERGEAIPDAYVLTQMAEIFGVTVDYLLSAHDAWENPNEPEEQEQRISRYSVNMIIAIAVLGVWTMALSVFVLLWLLGFIVWQSFVAGIHTYIYGAYLCIQSAQISAVCHSGLCAVRFCAAVFRAPPAEALAAFPDSDTGNRAGIFKLQYPAKTQEKTRKPNLMTMLHKW